MPNFSSFLDMSINVPTLLIAIAAMLAPPYYKW